MKYVIGGNHKARKRRGHHLLFHPRREANPLNPLLHSPSFSSLPVSMPGTQLLCQLGFIYLFQVDSKDGVYLVPCTQLPLLRLKR